MKGGHNRILERDHIMGPTRVLMQDPSPVGLPESLTMAHEDLTY